MLDVQLTTLDIAKNYPPSIQSLPCHFPAENPPTSKGNTQRCTRSILWKASVPNLRQMLPTLHPQWHRQWSLVKSPVQFLSHSDLISCLINSLLDSKFVLWYFLSSHHTKFSIHTIPHHQYIPCHIPSRKPICVFGLNLVTSPIHTLTHL